MTSISRELRPAVMVLLALTVITGILYPLAVTIVGQVLFPSQANGSLLTVAGKDVGSALIGQTFTDPGYLWGRPSAAGTGYDANASSGSNLAPTSQRLIDRVTQEVARLQVIHGDGPIPVELVTTSGSGLDPHISPAAARYQIERIADARGIPAADVQAIVDRHTAHPFLGLGADLVNVLEVNLELDGLRSMNRHGDARPTPEEMLARTGGGPDARGRLRVYLGMAPGVGKTYEMLEEAHRRAERGTDIVVGLVETHGRARTEELLAGLEIVPRRRVEHRGVVVEEMDPGAIIARHPEVVLVDELAHTNAPGSPREKRWQDVEAIRDAGIDVISTCNVQHVASAADAVATITGAPVHERLPDEVLAAADEIELIDMSPHALRQRMRHGNVYPPDRARIALDRFFTEANLTALRELSLRFTAGRVEAQLDAIGGPRTVDPVVGDRVLILVDERPASRRALRRGAALASTLRSRAVALAIRTPASNSWSAEQERDLRDALAFASDLGTTTETVEAPDVATAVLEAIRRHRATQVVLASRPMSALDRLRGPSLADRLLAAEPTLEVHVVGDGPDRADLFAAGAGRT